MLRIAALNDLAVLEHARQSTLLWSANSRPPVNRPVDCRRFKISHNLAQVYQSEIVDYILKKFGPQRAIMLFGSVRNGEDSPGSDIDIAVEIEGGKNVELRGIQGSDEQASALKEFEKNTGRKFMLCFFSRKNVDSSRYLDIVNGIVLHGFLEVRQ